MKKNYKISGFSKPVSSFLHFEMKTAGSLKLHHYIRGQLFAWIRMKNDIEINKQQ